VFRLRHGTPQWSADLKAAFTRAKTRLAHTTLDGVEWYWPEGERPESARHAPAEAVKLLAPFDPVAWDRRRFEMFWGWAYRFEAYTPASKRKLGYYALPMLWGDQVVGWANVSASGGSLDANFGYVAGKAPTGQAFKRELDLELDRMRSFLAPQD
jgi:uncharacterized protein YcaQ